MTCMLVAPIGIVGVVRGLRESRLPIAAGVALAIAALAAGLTPYLSTRLLVAPDNAMSWGAVRSGSQLLAHVLREDYGGPGTFSPHAGTVDLAANLRALVATLGRAWWWAPLAIGVAWLGMRCVRAPRPARTGDEPRTGWLALAASVLLAGPLLAARFDIEPVGLGLYVARRFHLLPMLLLALVIACGLDALLARVPARFARVTWIAALAWIATSAARSLPEVAAVQSPALEIGVRDMLVSLPPDAVIIVTDEDLAFGVAYFQLTEGLRGDVTVVIWPMVPLAWYRARLARAGVVVAAGEGVASARVAADVLAHGRPVLVDRYAVGVVAALPSYPFGILFRVLPAGSDRPSVDELFGDQPAPVRSLVARLRAAGPRRRLATDMHARYASTWRIIAQAMADAHGRDAAQIPLAYAQRFGPQP